MNTLVGYRQAVVGDVEDMARIYYGQKSYDKNLDDWKARISDKDTWSIVAIQDKELVGYIISFTGPDADGNMPEPQKRIRILKTLPAKEELLSPLLEKGIIKANELQLEYIEAWIFESEPNVKKDVFLNNGFQLTGEKRIVKDELKYRYYKEL